jgi:hypothetical protein
MDGNRRERKSDTPIDTYRVFSQLREGENLPDSSDIEEEMYQQCSVSSEQ